MSGKKKLGVLAVLIAAVMVIAGCSKKEDDKSSSDSNLNLVSSGKLTVCSDIPYAPFEFEDEANPGEYTGFDVELVEAIAKEMNLTVEWVVTPFDGILTALEAGQCDMIASSMTITEERQQQVNFSDPYFDADQSLLVKTTDEQTFTSLSTLGGKTIGVQSGTTGAEYAEANKPEGATVQAFEGADQLFLALESGQVQAVLQDFPVNAYRATQDDSFVVTESFPTGEQYGFAIAKSNTDLLNAVNSALTTLKGNGQYDTIFSTWFGPME